MESKTILVTGGAGYLGSVLCEHLLAAGHRVVVLDSFMFGQTPLFHLCANPRLEVVRGDARDEATVGRLLRDADVVLGGGKWTQKADRIPEYGPAVMVIKNGKPTPVN